MKQEYLFLVLVMTCWGCQDMKIGYLKASDGGDAELFKQEIVVRGGGVMELPLYTKLPAGRYVVTLRVSNDGYSSALPDVYTFIVK